jgi:hypothetical protein
MASVTRNQRLAISTTWEKPLKAATIAFAAAQEGAEL